MDGRLCAAVVARAHVFTGDHLTLYDSRRYLPYFSSGTVHQLPEVFIRPVSMVIKGLGPEAITPSSIQISLPKCATCASIHQCVIRAPAVVQSKQAGSGIWRTATMARRLAGSAWRLLWVALVTLTCLRGLSARSDLSYPCGSTTGPDSNGRKTFLGQRLPFV